MTHLHVTRLLVVVPNQAAVRAGGTVQRQPGDDFDVPPPVLRHPLLGLPAAPTLGSRLLVIQPAAVAGHVRPYRSALGGEGELRRKTQICHTGVGLDKIANLVLQSFLGSPVPPC